MERIATLEREIAVLRQKLNEKEKELYDLRQDWTPFYTNVPDGADTNQPVQLSKWAIERYSRQILLSSIGANGQAKLCGARVLVVGAGGLGCPAALYLAAAGVGEIGIVDYDTVDLTNLHRQVLHGEGDQGLSKVHSAANALRRINSRVKVTPYNTQLAPHNAMDIVNKYDVLLDCSDNPPARYMLNDAAQLSRIPLVSGSALKMEGQLTVYGYRANKNPNEKDPSYVGPCYRCLFPTPPPPEAVGSCSAHGVAGPVPGVIGVLQALEAIKLIVGHTHEQLLVGRMILFDGDDMTFRTVKLRSRSLDCAACSATRTITRLVDYEVFCKAQGREKDLELSILPPENRINPKELSMLLSSDQRHLLVDVRNESEFGMCSIGGAANHPIDGFAVKSSGLIAEMVRQGHAVTFICRRGNDSQIAAQLVLDQLDPGLREHVKDLVGGLHAWSKEIDHNFPIY
ncbi:adenylyltransferase and sulfurtransferase MOCS3 isoform X2 [Pectinophora gossypiella]|uniref:adenylyltransferase and sulfurtransferase MOCS3 isoform X2 n=1 Tax=Pectinophora gossypiella TaxID=13191 RepID=UPI00214E9C27|nr:adenylyltransferase and sulfurtransferase MOCS3 isoform X2 [Pectinophora gossypiella]